MGMTVFLRIMSVYTDVYKLCGNVANHIIRQQGNKLLPRIIAVIKKCFVPEGKNLPPQ